MDTGVPISVAAEEIVSGQISWRRPEPTQPEVKVSAADVFAGSMELAEQMLAEGGLPDAQAPLGADEAGAGVSAS